MTLQATETSQRLVSEWLASGALSGGTAPDVVVTHISRVFLTADRAFKLKRAVKYPFLDFTALESRAAAAKREIGINAPFSPGLYRRAVPVTRTPDGFALGGDGEIVDWIVEMNRFDSNGLFLDLLKQDELSPVLLDRVTDRIAAAHRDCPPNREIGGSAACRRVAEDIAATTGGFDAFFPALDAARHRLDARMRHGFVRRCHGDLHLGNLCLFRGQPMPFDGIEFSEEIGTADVLYDIAFLGMDLLAHERPDLAYRVLSRYLEAAGDYSGAGLLPLFMSLRAGVRAMVAALDSKQAERERYLLLANQLLRKRRPELIAIGGRSGTGKTALARSMIGERAALHLRSDATRKRLFAVNPETRLPQDAYSETASARTFSRLFRNARKALRSGSSVILDATFMAGKHRAEAERLAAETGVRFSGIWLDAPESIAAERARMRENDASDAGPDIVAAQYRSACIEPEGWLRLDACAATSVLLQKLQSC